jgi:hypothetical protein
MRLTGRWLEAANIGVPTPFRISYQLCQKTLRAPGAPVGLRATRSKLAAGRYRPPRNGKVFFLETAVNVFVHAISTRLRYLLNTSASKKRVGKSLACSPILISSGLFRPQLPILTGRNPSCSFRPV